MSRPNLIDLILLCQRDGQMKTRVSVLAVLLAIEESQIRSDLMVLTEADVLTFTANGDDVTITLSGVES